VRGGESLGEPSTFGRRDEQENRAWID